MTPEQRLARLHWRLDPLLAHLATHPTPAPLDDRDPDTWVDGDSDVRPWVDEPAADYVFDPPQMRDPQ